METDRRSLIQKYIMEGKDREGIRRELISQAVSTDGFEAEYSELLQEMGMSEPKPKVPEHVAATANTDYEHTAVDAQLPSIGALLKHGLAVFRKKWKEILVLSVLMLLPNILFFFIPQASPMINGGVVFVSIAVAVLLNVAISVIASGALLYVVINADNDTGFADALQWALSRFFSLLWLGFLSTVIFIGGALFLIIPALIFTIYSIFSYIVLVKEDARGMHALLRSADLVKGNFWGITLRVFVLMLVSIGFSVAASLFEGSLVEIVVTPIALLVQMILTAIILGAFVSMYSARAQAKPLFDLSSYNKLKWLYRFGAVIGTLAPIAVLLVMSASAFALFGNLTAETEMQWGMEEQANGEMEANFIDTFLQQSKVEATAASVKLSGGRMGSYEGACADITVVPPVECRNTETAFVVTAPLSNGDYYCVDSTDFSGVVDQPQEMGCQ